MSPDYLASAECESVEPLHDPVWLRVWLKINSLCGTRTLGLEVKHLILRGEGCYPHKYTCSFNKHRWKAKRRGYFCSQCLCGQWVIDLVFQNHCRNWNLSSSEDENAIKSIIKLMARRSRLIYSISKSLLELVELNDGTLLITAGTNACNALLQFFVLVLWSVVIFPVPVAHSCQGGYFLQG